MIRGATGPVNAIDADRRSPSVRIRSPYHGGTNPSVSGAAYSMRACLMWMSNTDRSTNLAPAL